MEKLEQPAVVAVVTEERISADEISNDQSIELILHTYTQSHTAC